MHLKHFHVILISAAILLGGGLGYWALRHYGMTQSSEDLETALVSLTLAALLSIYLYFFLRRMKQKGW